MHIPVGFIQGRLSLIKNNRIQSFPWGEWQNEFIKASMIKLSLIEWTIDSERFSENPLVTQSGYKEIISLSTKYNIKVPSVTCDFFMENPVWKSDPSVIREGIISIVNGMAKIGSQILVIPLVDNSSLKNISDTKAVKDFFINLIPELDKANVTVAFESDLNPKKFSKFINEFEKKYFGINYDLGNSASLGFDSAEEFMAYGSRIINVHVKDRKKGGNTVPLGEGDADFPKVFRFLRETDYKGNLILQTARSKDGQHEEVLIKYKELVENWWEAVNIA
jgi:L-ribulose-5-phosphate 3-epimerase